jgi:diguanylate cyclase (GGDEF)-like protein
VADEPKIEGSPPGNGRVGFAPRRSRLNRQTVEVVALSIILAGVASLTIGFLPDIGDSLRPSGTWAGLVIALGFATTLLTVVRIEFRGNAILFSLSEIPLAFAVVFLDPVLGTLCRVVASGLVFALVKKPPIHKQFFNLSLFAFETSVAYAAIRTVCVPDARSDIEVILCATVAVTLAGSAGSIAVAIAVSRLVGDTLRRIVDNLKLVWALVVNGAMAGALLSLFLLSPTFAALATVPVVALWYLMRRHGRLGQQLRDLRAIHGFAGRIGRSLDLDEIADSAVIEASHMLRADFTMLAVVAAGGNTRMFATGGSPQQSEQLRIAEWPSLVDGDPVVVLTGSEMVAAGFPGLGVCGEAIVALIDDDIGTMGVVIMARRNNSTTEFDTDDADRARSLADQLAASLRRSMLHRQMQFEARHDALTGLPNRTSLQRHLAATSSEDLDHQHRYVMMMDLDRFKEVNDTLGHHAGDELLIEFTRRISGQLGPTDFLARLAGDEFAVVTIGHSEDEVIELARSCIDAAAEPVTLDGLQLVVTASVGIAQISSSDTDPETSLRHADIAMYNAKSRHVGVEFFRSELDRRTPARLSMLGDLRRSLDDGELSVAYQPKLDLATGLITGAEALARWNHHARGSVPPTDFVRVAEDTGLIKQLTDTVLAQGIVELRHLQDIGHHISLSVNLSTHDLFDANLAGRVAGYLSQHGVNPWSLTLEITESSLLLEAPSSRSTIQELHELGVHLSIDDFGTGYSSLTYLRQLPVRELKVDHSFIANMLIDQQNEVIVRSTIDLGHNLGLEVVAEGVDSEQVLQQLRNIGCDVAQGYAVSRPLDAEHFATWLSTSHHPGRRFDFTQPEGWAFTAEQQKTPLAAPHEV